eukprot:421095-Pleurochrysis_carterae.AAC.1
MHRVVTIRNNTPCSIMVDRTTAAEIIEPLFFLPCSPRTSRPRLRTGIKQPLISSREPMQAGRTSIVLKAVLSPARACSKRVRCSSQAQRAPRE